MRKAKSRNFILMVCGVFITLLLGFVVAKTIVNVLNEIDSKNTTEEIQKNILSSSSKVKLNGMGNFIDSTPRVDKTTISEFNVKLNHKDDEVNYSISFCNMNDKELVYDDLIVEAISCIDEVGNDDCSNISIDSYVSKKNKRLEKKDIISENSCINLVVDAKYIGEVEQETEVSISRIVLKLKENKR